MLLPSLALALGALQAPVVSAPPQLAVHAIRFFAPQAGETMVLAFVQVPYILAEPAGDRIAWHTQLEVVDAGGERLYAEDWWAGAPASFRVPEAYGIEALRFRPVNAGRYTIRVTVRDSVSGRTAMVETEVVAFSDPPPVSDMLLASEMRVTAPGDTSTLPGEIARGNLRFITAPDLTLDGLTPRLSFMLEAYSTAEAGATTRLTIRQKGDGTTIYQLAPFEQTIPAGGGVIRGQFPLEGLAEGQYELVASITMAGSVTERTAGFAIGSLEAAMARSIATRNAQKGLDEQYFASLSEDELDAAADVLEVIAKSSDLAVYKASGDGALTVSAKRQFLVQFWAERDLDRSTPINETRLAFYDAIDYADQLFGESGRNARPGWKTDRGRVFVRYGRPDERNPFPSGNRAPAYEIWRYTQGRLRFYIFADENNFGNYRLIKSNDLQEPGTQNWCEILTPQVVRNDVEPFLGQRFLVLTGDPDDAGETGSGGQILCN
jgi:GWxTD domain-containing protein